MKKTMLATCAFAAFAIGLFAAEGEPYLVDNLTVWLRADKGLTTNAVGGVTSWANFGTSGKVLDMAPQSDNSAPHIAYTANGIGGQPSVSFDGEAYLQAAGSTAMSITANGGAWFIVFKTDMDDTERGNRAIFGGEGSNRRLGLHFIAGSRNVRGFFFNDTAGGDMAVEAGRCSSVIPNRTTARGVASACATKRFQGNTGSPSPRTD